MKRRNDGPTITMNGFAIDDKKNGPNKYLILAISIILGCLYYVLFSSYETMGALLLYVALATVGLNIVALPAFAASRAHERLFSYSVGLIPTVGVGIGFTVELTQGRGNFVADIVRTLLVSWMFAIPLVTLGFVLGGGWRHRQHLRNNLQYILVPTGIAMLVTGLLIALWLFTGVLSVDTLA